MSEHVRAGSLSAEVVLLGVDALLLGGAAREEPLKALGEDRDGQCDRRDRHERFCDRHVVEVVVVDPPEEGYHKYDDTDNKTFGHGFS